MRLGLIIVGPKETFWKIIDFLFTTSEFVLVNIETQECKTITVQEYNDHYFNPEV